MSLPRNLPGPEGWPFWFMTLLAVVNGIAMWLIARDWHNREELSHDPDVRRASSLLRWIFILLGCGFIFPLARVFVSVWIPYLVYLATLTVMLWRYALYAPTVTTVKSSMEKDAQKARRARVITSAPQGTTLEELKDRLLQISLELDPTT